MAEQTFRRWSRHGVWKRLLELAQARGGVELGMAFLDGTSIRAHHKAAGAARNGRTVAQRDEDEGLGRSRGGFGTKACAIVDASGRAIGFALAPGQAHELPLAPTLLALLVAIPLRILGDRGYSSHAFREARSGTSEPARRSRPSATRRRSPVRPGSRGRFGMRVYADVGINTHPEPTPS